MGVKHPFLIFEVSHGKYSDSELEEFSREYEKAAEEVVKEYTKAAENYPAGNPAQ